jgi:nucleotide-binding universal stress UspA family protein
MTVESGTVVVAVGSGSTGQALDWAAAEASARGCRLLVVHAETLHWGPVDCWGVVPFADLWPDRVSAEHVARTAVTRARVVAPDIDVTAVLEFGGTVPSLLSRSRGAQLLVVGGRHAPFGARFAHRLFRSVGERVAGRARCPVAVVRPLPTGARAVSAPRVVVGIDGRGSCADVLGFAFRAAAQRAVPLLAVHAWTPDGPADHEGVCGPVAASEARAHECLDQALAPWRNRFADVPVGTWLTTADPAAALIRESCGAALVVVGSRARGPGGRIFSSVGRSVARRARCPVVVVGTGTATPDEAGASGRRTAHPGTEQFGTEPDHRPGTPWE